MSKATVPATDDPLLDIKINNPLHKIITILQDIKSQKAFSFTLKGSVGIVGVAVVLTGFGIFSGNKILCDKGLYGKVGTVRVLEVTQEVNVRPIANKIKALLGRPIAASPTKVVFVVNDIEGVTRLLYSKQDYLEGFAGHRVIATGGYNACSHELQVLDSGIEIY